MVDFRPMIASREEFEFVQSAQVEPDNLVDNVLDWRVVAFTDSIPRFFDLGEAIFQKVNDIGRFLGRMQGNWPDQPVSALVGFRELVREINYAVVKAVQRAVFGKRPRIQVH